MNRLLRQTFQAGAAAGLWGLRRIDRVVNGSVSGLPMDEIQRDPYRGFAILRERGNVLRSFANRGGMVMGFAEAQAVFRDPRFSSDLRNNRFLVRILRAAAGRQRLTILDDPSMLNLDPPDHTRLRKLAQQGFINRFVQSLEPRIAAITRECLDSFDPVTGEFDIMTQLAMPLPAIVIAELLGLPEEDRTRFQQLSNELVHVTALGNDELMARGANANEALVIYFDELIASKRRNPDQGFISRLIAAEEAGDRLSAPELISTCILLMAAGHETTTRLIGNGMYTLLRHPDQLALLRDNPALMPNAIEEMLRFEPPVQLMPRTARENFEFFGKRIRKDQLVLPIIASANRDPVANPDPDRFDITRENIRHVSFGHGIHLCLGLNLARLEARIALNMLLKEFPQMSLKTTEPTWHASALVRGMDSLVIRASGVQAAA